METKGRLNLLYFVFIASLPFGLMACGGGGGDPTGISYTGITTQTKIDEVNAMALAIGAWTSSDLGSNIDIFNSAQSVDETLYGSCNTLGGVDGAIINGNINETTGTFNGTINFSNFCDEGMTINGLANFTGVVDLNTEELTNFTLSFSSLALEFEDEYITINGTMTADYVSVPILVTMSFIIRDNNLLETYWFRDAQIQLLGNADNVEITGMSGRYYDPYYGFVEIAVGESIRIYDTDNWPSSGSIILTGAQGTVGNTKALLTFLNLTEYQVDVDTDGDGLYDDFNSGTQLW